MGMVLLPFLMVMSITENFYKGNCTAMALLTGRMEGFTQDNGLKIKLQGMGLATGLMEINMRAPILMINSMVLGNFQALQIIKSLRESG